jgi:hypothetical protein
MSTIGELPWLLVLEQALAQFFAHLWVERFWQ